MFHGFDTDSTMLRIGAMNLMLHDINNPDGDDSYGEILSDLLEIVKEELFEEDD